MSSKIENITTPAIASNVASAESDLLSGYVDCIKIEVRTALNAASSNTCTVTITDNVLGRTLLTATGITGVANVYPLQVQAKGVDGAAITGIYQRFYLASQRLTVAVTSGTNTDYVRVYGVIAPQ
jgi:hypothetical protein